MSPSTINKRRQRERHAAYGRRYREKQKLRAQVPRLADFQFHGDTVIASDLEVVAGWFDGQGRFCREARHDEATVFHGLLRKLHSNPEFEMSPPVEKFYEDCLTRLPNVVEKHARYQAALRAEADAIAEWQRRREEERVS